MSFNNRIANVGASARASDFQATSDYASTADDRALEITVTPGAAQKKIVPLSEESATVNPRLLVVGKDTDATLANGKVRVRPAHFVAGVLGDPNTIGLGGKATVEDSPTFANNSSGSTRTDLLYATLSYGASITQSVRQKPTAGGAPVSATLNIENQITVTLGIIPGVASGSPLASLPADSGSGKLAVYNFGLAAVSIANGFSGGAINQASIAQLWSGGWVQPQRVRGPRPMSIYYGAANERAVGDISTMVQGAERAGSDIRFFAHFKNLPTTIAGGTGVFLDTTIDWRNRPFWGILGYAGSAANLPLAGSSMSSFVGSANNNPGAISGTTFFGFGSPAGNIPGVLLYTSAAASSQIRLGVDSASGGLFFFRDPAHAPIDSTNGDVLFLWINAMDRFVAGF